MHCSERGITLQNERLRKDGSEKLGSFYISQETTATVDPGVLKSAVIKKQSSLGWVGLPQEMKTLILLFDIMRALNPHFLRVSSCLAAAYWKDNLTPQSLFSPVGPSLCWGFLLFLETTAFSCTDVFLRRGQGTNTRDAWLGWWKLPSSHIHF